LSPALHNRHRSTVLFTAGRQTRCNQGGGRARILLRKADGYCPKQTVTQQWVGVPLRPLRGGFPLNRSPLAYRVRQQAIPLGALWQASRFRDCRRRVGADGLISQAHCCCVFSGAIGQALDPSGSLGQ